MKKSAQRRRKHCALAVVRRSQKFSPRRRPPSRGRGTAKSAGDGHYLYLHTQFGEDRCTQFRVIVVTDPHTNKHPPPHRQDRLQYTALQLARSVKSAQRRRKHYALAVVRRSQKFSPRRRPPSRGAGRPKFYQLEMVTTFTYRPSLVKIDARNFELWW